jgi:1-deoxy-D-xylulose-5-phosphate reductoisomerase
VHAVISLCDGASLAHLGHPVMRVPIAYALHHPERVDVPVPTLDLARVGALTFEPPDLDAFPCLRLSREAAMAGGTGPCVLNAANEVAVHAFLGGRLPFMGIPAVIEQTLERVPAARVHAFDSLYEADGEARAVAGELLKDWPDASPRHQTAGRAPRGGTPFTA